MANTWIKMRTDIAGDPAVILIATVTGLDEDTVVGKLHRIWSWADSQTETGEIPSVTFAWINKMVGTKRFAESMKQAGWLDEKDGYLILPEFQKHNGDSAKKRAQTAKRNVKMRESLRHDRDATSVTKSASREDKRREEREKDIPSAAIPARLPGYLTQTRPTAHHPPESSEEHWLISEIQRVTKRQLGSGDRGKLGELIAEIESAEPPVIDGKPQPWATVWPRAVAASLKLASNTAPVPLASFARTMAMGCIASGLWPGAERSRESVEPETELGRYLREQNGVKA